MAHTPLRSFTHGGHDVRIRSAAAQIAAHPLADLVVTSRVAFVDACQAAHDLSGGAVAALKGIVPDESGLQHMEIAFCADAFDCGDLLALLHDGQTKAGVDAAAIH